MADRSDCNEYGIESTATGVIVHVYVAPRASANRVAGAHNGALKVALTAPPVDGAANRALVEFLAKVLGVPRSAVLISSGHTSRNKIVEISGISCRDALEKLLPSGSKSDA